MCGYTVDPLLSFIKKPDAAFLFHLDSYTGDRSSNEWKNNEKIPTIDVGRKTIPNLIKIIKDYKIEVFVCFTFQSQLDKLIWNICRILDLPIILHDHGIVFGNRVARGSKFTNPWPKIKRKLFFMVVKMHFSLTKINSYKNFSKSHRYDFDQYIIYSKNNLLYYRQFFILDEQNLIIGGVPLFCDKSELLQLIDQKKERKLLYFHQPLRKFGFSTLSKDEEITYFEGINIIAKKHNLLLEIRLHPSQSVDEYQSHSWDSNIVFNNNQKMAEQAASAYAIIGHWSSAMAISYPLKIPLIILEYPKIKATFKKYSTIFQNLGLYCEKISFLDQVLVKCEKLDNSDWSVSKWEELIGTCNTVENDAKILKNAILRAKKPSKLTTIL